MFEEKDFEWLRIIECLKKTGMSLDVYKRQVHVNKSLLVFRDFGFQHTATKESNDRSIDVAPAYMEFRCV